MSPVQFLVAFEITRKHHIQGNTAQEEPPCRCHHKGYLIVKGSAVVAAVEEVVDRHYKEGRNETYKIKACKPGFIIAHDRFLSN